MYFSADSYFAQNFKMALVSLLFNLETQYCTQSSIQSEAIYKQAIIYLIYVEKNYKCYKNFTCSSLCFSRSDMKSARFHEIHQISSMKSAGFNDIHWISCIKSARFHEICI